MPDMQVAGESGGSGTEMGKWIYSFDGGGSEGGAEMRNLLGGKGANLAEMAAIGLPVPPGLDLSDEQKAKIQEIRKEAMEEAKDADPKKRREIFEQMNKYIHAVFTDEQREKLKELMKKHGRRPPDELQAAGEQCTHGLAGSGPGHQGNRSGDDGCFEAQARERDREAAIKCTREIPHLAQKAVEARDESFP